MLRPTLLLVACAGALACASVVTAAESPRERARACAALEAQYQQLERRMRAGYGATQAGRLWERRRQLQAHRWSLRCQDLSHRGR